MPKYGINKATLLGNVGTEPELKYLEGGIAVCSFRLATTERIPGRDGSHTDRTDWHNIVLWRQKAELAQKFLRVGAGVYIEGRIATRSWDGPDGQKRYRTEIEVDKIRLLDSAPEQGGAATLKAEERKAPSEPPKHPNPNPPVEGPDDDLPF
jgi:single-strand DNA-binding protein